MNLAELIDTVPDFPKKGINFRDITPLVASPVALQFIADKLGESALAAKAEVIVAIEARGFLFAGPLSVTKNLPCYLARKPGKLPKPTVSESYGLEYGAAELHIHRDTPLSGKNVFVVDDVLATGGTALAAAALVEQLGGIVCGYGFVIELSGLPGRQKLQGQATVRSLVKLDA